MIKVVCVGKVKEKYLQEAISDYMKRLSKYHKVSIIELEDSNMEEESFNVSSLALQVGVEQKQLYRKVKQFTGMSPVNYIRKLRMKKAAILLAQQKFTVSEVMYLVGYSNASHFARCFTQEYGMSPKTFMKTKMSTES